MKNSLLICLLTLCGFSASAQTDSTRQLTVSRIFIEGNYKTKPQIITRELSFNEGDTYFKYQLDSMFIWDGNRIYNTNLFNKVTFELVNEADDHTEVKILVDERWYFYPIPIFRLIDRNFNDWWVNRDRDLSRVNYGIRLTQFNFRGRAERLRLIAQFGFTNVFALQYNIPYIDKKQKQGLSFNLSYFQAKNVPFTTIDNVRRFASSEDNILRQAYQNSVTYSYRSSFYSYHRITGGHLRLDIDPEIAELNPNYLGDGKTQQQRFWIGYRYIWDKRNNLNYPTNGEWYRAGLSKHGFGFYNDGVDFWLAKVNLTKYWEFKDNFFLVGDVSILSSFPEERDYFNYYSIGILQEVLRGYDLNIIEASSYILQRNEFKHRLFTRAYDVSRAIPVRQFQTFPITIYGKVFFDQGYARSYPDYDGSDLLTDKYLYSYGAGLDLILLYDITFRLELSQNTLGETNFFINFLSLF